MRKSAQEAKKARRKARKDARDHGYTVALETLEAAAMPPKSWSCIGFEGRSNVRLSALKALLHSDELRAFDPDLAQT